MKLQEILGNIQYLEIIGDTDKEIANLSQDSRDENLRDTLYFAVPGTVVDGHTFISNVISSGSIAIVCEQLPKELPDGVTFIKVEDVKKTMGQMASNFYGNPSSELIVIAVTGTNGKTSIATYISQSLEYFDAQVLLLSTAGDYFRGQLINLERKASSSLEIIELHKVLRNYVDQGATHCCLEATSHALDQDRLSGIDVDFAIFSNLTKDHLDYHKNFEAYAHAKSLLFKYLKKDATVISNLDDRYGSSMLEGSIARKISYGKNNSTYDYSFVIETIDTKGTHCKINGNSISLPLIGEFNIYNITATFATLSELGFPTKNIVNAFGNISGVRGRMEIIHNERDIIAIVDYAHTPDALENVLNTLKNIPHASLITVFGCGGDRDKTKRPEMAHIGQKLSDKVIYTSDNPRTEDIDQIFSDMRKGVDTNVQNFHFVSGREEAIRTATTIANPKDIILIAGKGHETYQIIGTEKKHFDDREVLIKYLQS